MSIKSSSLIALCLLAICECVPPYQSSGGDYSGYNGGSAGYGSHHEEDYHHEPKAYAFGYSVKDYKKGTNFNQHESSDGHATKGQYEVALPDGRMQIVSYHADWKNGYHADVKYVGEAHHPEIYATNYGAQHDTGHANGGGYNYGNGNGATSNNFQYLGANAAQTGGNGGYSSQPGY